MSELRTEARLLLQTVEDRLLEWRSLVPAAAGVTAADDEVALNTDHADHAAAPGNGCPLCALLAVLRGERPELAAALLDGAVTALQLVRGLVSEQAEQPGPTEQPERPVPAGAAADAPTERAATAGPARTAATRRRPPERIRIS